MQIYVNNLRLEVEDTGERDRPAVLLIAGMSMQLIVWPEAMVHKLHQAGYRVIRLDNRDIGLSQDMAHLPAPNTMSGDSLRSQGAAAGRTASTRRTV